MEKTELGEFLKTLRKRQHITQEYLASQLGVRRQSYSHYETGRNTPPLDILIHLSQIYNIPVEAFTQLSEKSKPAASNTIPIISDDNGKYVVCNSPSDLLQYINLSPSETDLINHFRLLDRRDQYDILQITKLKVKIGEKRSTK